MPHKRSNNRRNKQAERLVSMNRGSRAEVVFDDRDNALPQMSEDAQLEVRTIIQDRYQSARPQTDKMAQKMNEQEKQYQGEWIDPNVDADEKIFLPKTRENIQTVYAYIMLLVSQLKPIVTMEPMVSSIAAADEEYRQAKVAEALLDYYFNDVWHIRDDIFPKWLKHFLKFSMGIWKVTYREDKFFPDLKLDVVDRSLFYVDPIAHDVKDSRWAIEKYYIPRTEAWARVDGGHWVLDNEAEMILGTGYKGSENGISEAVLRRYMGDNFTEGMNVSEDELVEVWDYWQAPHSGLDSTYTVILGGEEGKVVRHGANPFPYKGLPFRAKSFDPNEHRPDGVGMIQQFEPFQKVINTFLNMRLTDVRKNIIRPVAATGQFIDAQTQQDFKEGQKIVRLSEEVMEASKDPGFDLRKHFVPLPFETSTGELLTTDLPFILGQGKESSAISDVFRGQSPPHQATLGQIQEQLSRNQGVFRPIYTQVMRGFEEVAEICMKYFKSPDFFPEDRIVKIIGKNRYADILHGWHQVPGSNTQIRSVSADELSVDVVLDAVNGADSLSSRTALMSSFEQMFQGIGQVPGLFETLQGEFNFAEVVGWMLNASGHDIDTIRLSPEEKQAKEQQRQAEEQAAMQAQQQAQQQQAQLEMQLEQAKSQLRMQEEQTRVQMATQSQQHVAEVKGQLDIAKDQQQATMSNEAMIQQIAMKISETLSADLIRMNEEARLERQNSNIAVGHGNEIKSGGSNSQNN